LGAAAVFVALSAAPPSALRAAEINDARQAMNDKNFPRAVEILDAFLAERPSDHRALALRGEAHLDVYSPDAPTKALADLNRAIEIQPAKNGHDLLSRGRAYKMLGDYDKALADLNKAIELAPDDAERYFHRGDTYTYRKDFEASVRV
jgi:tetratricopeptide (TPR) repeat protein